MNPTLKIQKILTFEIFGRFTLDLSQDCPFPTTPILNDIGIASDADDTIFFIRHVATLVLLLKP